jgi:15-cis-phytoene synthase
MKELYDRLSEQCSVITTQRYSTSFSLGIKFLSPAIRPAIYGIYGFVRLADEIVDSFHAYNKVGLLDQLRAETFAAIKDGISINPILNSFQHVVNRYGIEPMLIQAFLDSMEMDLEKKIYNKALYDQYVFGSAEVVGLMCLQVFCHEKADDFETLKYSAMKLGSAFQKVNFLRDIKADSEELGRMYFPEVNFNHFTEDAKAEIEKDIEAEFKQALTGIKRLPLSSRKGVYLAYIYYKVLFNKIRRVPARQIRDTRIRVPDHQKVGLMFQCLIMQRFNMV